jgi:hypothetical protein
MSASRGKGPSGNSTRGAVLEALAQTSVRQRTREEDELNIGSRCNQSAQRRYFFKTRRTGNHLSLL